MAGFWQTIVDPQLWGGTAGGAFLGLVTGHFKTNRGRITKLEQKVEECRKRDADFQVLGAGFRMIVGEVMRENPNSPALKMCGDLLSRKFGPPPTVADFADMLKQADQVSPEPWDGPRRNWGEDDA